MKICRDCNKLYADNVRFCPDCGKALIEAQVDKSVKDLMKHNKEMLPKRIDNPFQKLVSKFKSLSDSAKKKIILGASLFLVLIVAIPIIITATQSPAQKVMNDYVRAINNKDIVKLASTLYPEKAGTDYTNFINENKHDYFQGITHFKMDSFEVIEYYKKDYIFAKVTLTIELEFFGTSTDTYSLHFLYSMTSKKWHLASDIDYVERENMLPYDFVHPKVRLEGIEGFIKQSDGNFFLETKETTLDLSKATIKIPEGATFTVSKTELQPGTNYVSFIVSSTDNKHRRVYTLKIVIPYMYSIELTGNIENAGSISGPDKAFAADSVTIQATTNPGYTWLGWFDGSTKVSLGESGTYAWIMPSRNVVFEARWEANTYTITFDSNGGEGGTAQTIGTFGQSMPSAVKPTKVGYEFIGYFDADDRQYYDSNMTSSRNFDVLSNLKITARWIPITSHVILNPNRGQLGTYSTNATYGEPLPNHLTPPSFSGYVFNGFWDTPDSVGGKQYYDENMMSVNVWDKTDEQINIYARWIALSFTITFDKQGGTGGSDSVLATFGSPMPTATAPTKPGYTFAGYSFSFSYYYDASMESARSWDFTQDATLYANWNPNTYKVELNANQGQTQVSIITVVFDSPMPLISIPTRTGYTFLGYFDASNVMYYNQHGQSTARWDKVQDSMLIAQWSINTYKVTFDKQEGSGGDHFVNAVFGQAMPSATAPSRLGYVFQGYFDHQGKRYYDVDMKSVSQWDKTSDTTLTARWELGTVGLEYKLESISGLGWVYAVTGIGSATGSSIVIPEAYNGYSVSIIGTNAFADCTHITSVTWQSIAYIRQGAFTNTGIWNSAPNNGVVVVNNWIVGYKGIVAHLLITDGIVGIADFAFSGNNNLISVNSISRSLYYIGRSAFEYCNNLESVTIRSSVTRIDMYAFSYNSKLTLFTNRSSAAAGWHQYWNSISNPVLWNSELFYMDHSYVVSITKTASTSSLAGNPHRYGYVFDGWYTSSTFGGTKYMSVASAPNGTLYAKWILK